MPKPFKTIDEQLVILKERGLTIADENEAKLFLQKNNYYRVSGYSLTLRDHDEFYHGVTFRNIIDIYYFDHSFRMLLLDFLEKIEVMIKSVYAYEFSKQYGPFGYLDESNFTDAKKFEDISEKIKKQTLQHLKDEAFLKHFVKELREPIPCWAIVEILTFSDISKLYAISQSLLQKNIAKYFNLSMNDSHKILGKYLYGMTIIRNFCAHGSRLYNRLFITKPSLNSKEKKLLLKNSEGNPDNSKLFGYILIMKRLLSANEFSAFKQKLIQLHKNFSFVDMTYYGFCVDWKKLL